MHFIKLNSKLIIFLLSIINCKKLLASTECFWVTGIVKCQKDTFKVVNATIEVYDLDSPQNASYL